MWFANECYDIFDDNNKTVDLQKNELYYEFIMKLDKLFYELNVKNVHEKFYIFAYLLWNGYFSINKEYMYSTKIQDELLNIFLGAGCCRQNSNLLYNLFDFENVNTQLLSICYKKMKEKYSLHIPIEIDDNEPKKNKSYYNRINHQVVYLKDEYLMLDPTMISEIEIRNGHTYCFNGKYIIDKSKTEDHFFLKESLKNIKKNCLKVDNIEFIYKDAYEKCLASELLFSDFYGDCHNIYESSQQLVMNYPDSIIS